LPIRPSKGFRVASVATIDPIQYLIERKFAMARGLARVPASVSVEGRARMSNPQLARQIAAYKAQLLQLPPEELEALAESEFEKQRAEIAAKAEREERERFFNQPYARADFGHWSKATYWTLDEAIALSFGKAPECVNWKSISPLVGTSTFALQYHRRRDLAQRSLAWQQLYDPVLPGIFLAWAKRTGIEVPPELEAAVSARGKQIADWKTLYDDLKATFDDHHKQWMVMSDEKEQLINQLRGRIEALEAELASAVTTILPQSSEKPLNARERDSLLSMVIGMAIGGYGYNPSESRSKQPSAIAGDLEVAGVALDVDTVRKWLKEAAELLPPSKETK
jgi:hypothetical protein